ncbi:MAG: PAS domain S-box protein, partial [Burkholderiales bacterium]|nr:PAS domain S-box protein [Burkholderiales bacterium]
MNEQELFSQFWRERCNDAFECMRDDLAGGRAQGLALAQQGEASKNMVMQQAGQLVLAFAALRDGQAEQAQKMLQMRLLQMTKDPINLLLLHNIQALIHSNQGRYQLAYEYAHQHLMPLLKNYQGRESMRALLAMGVFAVEYNQPEEAMRHYFNALEIVATLRLAKSWRAHLNANIGELLCHSGNAEDAEPLLLEAIELARQPDKPWLQTYVATIFAMCQLVLDKHENALEAIAPQVRTFETELRAGTLSHPRNCTLCLCIAAYALAARNRLDEAERLFALLEVHVDKIDEQQHLAYVYWLRGHLLHRRGNLEQACVALNQAVAALGNVDFDFMPLRVRLELSEIYSELGDWKSSLEEYRQYHALFERAQGKASRMHMQVLLIQSELREAENARKHAEKAAMERRELADNLRHSLAERDTILENSMVGIAFMNPQGEIIWCNATLGNIFGLSPEEYKSMDLQQHFADSADFARMRDTVSGSQNRDGGPPFEDECRMLRADGSAIWVYLSGRSVPTNNTKRGTVWVVMDISRRHQLEIDLNRSEEHYRLVVDNAVEGIAVLQDGKIVFANPFIIELTKVDSSEILGTSFMPFIHP